MAKRIKPTPLTTRAKGDISKTSPNSTANSNVTIEKLVTLFDSYLVSLNRAKATRASHKYALRVFVNFIGAGRDVRKITEQDIDDFRTWLFRTQDEEGNPLKAHAPRTVNTYLDCLQNFLDWAVRKGHISKAPNIEKAKVPRHKPKPVFEPGEFEAVLDACRYEATLLLQLRARAIIMLLYDGGLRASELCNALWANLELDEVDGEPSHALLVDGAKDGGERYVPIAPAVWDAIKAYREELAQPHGRARKRIGSQPEYIFVSNHDPQKPLTVSGLRRMCVRLEEYCEVHANPHKFRRGWATYWLNNEFGDRDIESLMLIGGWRDRETLLRHYAHVRKKTLIRSARVNSPLARGVLTKKAQGQSVETEAEKYRQAGD